MLEKQILKNLFYGNINEADRSIKEFQIGSLLSSWIFSREFFVAP